MNARFRNAVLVTLASCAGAAALLGLRRTPAAATRDTTEVAAGPLQVWSVYDGFLESRRVANVLSQLYGAATITEMAPDGASVRRGEALVRFDGSQWERDLLRLQREEAFARAELSGLVNARIPLETSALEAKVASAWRQYTNEVELLRDDQQLLDEGLAPEQDVAAQRARRDAALAAARAAEQELRLTRAYAHPCAADRAAVAARTAAQELELAQRQMSNCVVRAPADGVVGYRSVSVGGEFRTVRVGDTVYRNLPFMTLSDMSDLVLRCDVPEAELTRVAAGNRAVVRPLAYPDLSIEGEVDAVGSMAQSLQGRPGGQKYFNVTIRLKESPGVLRSGMSAQARVLSHANPSALLVPRSAVRWEGDSALCDAVRGDHTQRIAVKLGFANETHFEVLSGLKPGDRVLTR